MSAKTADLTDVIISGIKSRTEQTESYQHSATEAAQINVGCSRSQDATSPCNTAKCRALHSSMRTESNGHRCSIQFGPRTKNKDADQKFTINNGPSDEYKPKLSPAGTDFQTRNDCFDAAGSPKSNLAPYIVRQKQTAATNSPPAVKMEERCRWLMPSVRNTCGEQCTCGTRERCHVRHFYKSAFSTSLPTVDVDSNMNSDVRHLREIHLSLTHKCNQFLDTRLSSKGTEASDTRYPTTPIDIMLEKDQACERTKLVIVASPNTSSSGFVDSSQTERLEMGTNLEPRSQLQTPRSLVSDATAGHSQTLAPQRHHSELCGATAAHSQTLAPQRHHSELCGATAQRLVGTIATSSGNSVAGCCRICYEGISKEALISPCKCAGTMGNIHRSCIEKWLGSSNSDKCEICDFEYITLREPRPFKEWLCRPTRRSDRRNLYGDLACFFLLTPLAAVSSWLCASGSVSYAHFQNSEWEAVGLLTLTLFLIMIYFVWCVVAVRYHHGIFLEWSKKNQRVRVLGLQQLEQYSPFQQHPIPSMYSLN